MVETDQERYFNVTNATLSVLQEGFGDFIHAQLDTDIYRATKCFLFDANTSNVKASIYSPISYIGNHQSSLVIKGLLSVDSTSF